MKTTTPPRFRPRLIHTHARTGDGGKIAYLIVDPARPPVLIGPVSSPQYRLIQSLFSPANAWHTRFYPVAQTTERTYEHMLGTGPYSTVSARMYDAMEAAVTRVIESIKKSEAGKYLTFTKTSHYITMGITPA